jgi:hypothetical protein
MEADAGVRLTLKQIVEGHVPEAYSPHSESWVDQTAEYRQFLAKYRPSWAKDLLWLWQGPFIEEDILDRLRRVSAPTLGTGAGIPDGVACGHPGCLSHVTHPCEGCGRIAGHYQSEANMTRFAFRWVSLGKVTEVQSLFPSEEGPTPDSRPVHPRRLGGISRMRHGDTWNQDIGIAVAMVRFRDNGHFNSQERALSESLRVRATESLPPNCWGDFFLSLGELLDLLRLRTEFRIALAVEAERERGRAKCMDCVIGSPSPDSPIERAVEAIRMVVEVRGERAYPDLIGAPLSQAAVAEACAKRLLAITGCLTTRKSR